MEIVSPRLIASASICAIIEWMHLQHWKQSAWFINNCDLNVAAVTVPLAFRCVSWAFWTFVTWSAFGSATNWPSLFAAVALLWCLFAGFGIRFSLRSPIRADPLRRDCRHRRHRFAAFFPLRWGVGLRCPGGVQHIVPTEWWGMMLDIIWNLANYYFDVIYVNIQYTCYFLKKFKGNLNFVLSCKLSEKLYYFF